MKKINSLLFKTLEIVLALSMVLALSTAVVAADAYPSKPVRLIIPFSPGGGTDIMGREIAAKLTERLGKQVIVDNRTGAGGVIGSEIAAKAEPDGYTLLMVSGFYGMVPSLYKLPFDPEKSFIPVAMLCEVANMLVIHPSVPANSLKELIAFAKQQPGRLIFAGAGVGSSVHMEAELFKRMVGIDVKIVQFKGGSPAMIDVVGGHSHAMIGSITQTLPHIKSGKFRVLGSGGVKRSVILPDVPTIAEAGVPGYESSQWFGVLAPAGTPVPIVNRLTEEIKAILATGEIKAWFLTQGAEVNYLGPTEFGSFIEREISKWVRIVKESNIKVE